MLYQRGKKLIDCFLRVQVYVTDVPVVSAFISPGNDTPAFLSGWDFREKHMLISFLVLGR